VLYEDDAVVVLDKPAGLPAVPVKGSDTPSAWSLLSAKLKLKDNEPWWCIASIVLRPGFCSLRKLRRIAIHSFDSFLAHTPIRQYLAVVRGRPGAQEGTLVHYFRREGMFQTLRTESDSKAARAELRYRVERPLRDAALVRVALATGLQNQIRVQFAAIGHPVVR